MSPLILIIGEPPINDLIPLLTSLHLSTALLLIATHSPPLIPQITHGPALRILRLSQPLALHDSGALRLVNLLKKAQRVAHLWPRDSSPHFIQFTQSSQNGHFSIIEPVSYLPATTPYPSPPPSTSEHATPPPPQNKKLHRTRHDKPIYKPFDAIINFIPHGLQDKAILKHAILITTITAQFIAPPTRISSPHSSSPISPSNSFSSASSPLTSPCPSPPPIINKRSSPTQTQSAKPKNRFSLLFSTPSPSPPSPPPPPSLLPPHHDLNDASCKMKNAHLVHILPVGWTPDSATDLGPNRHPHSVNHHPKIMIGTGRHCKPKLVQSIELFLLSFTYPLGNIVPRNFGSGLRPGTLPSHASILNKTPQIFSSTSFINEKSVNPRPVSSNSFKSTTGAYQQEISLIPTSLSTPSNPTFSSNIDQPLKPVPYLLASGIFGKCAHGSNMSRLSSGSSADDTYTDPDATPLSIGETILLGALDFDHMLGHGNRRAWIGNVDDVVFFNGRPGKTGVGKAKGQELVVTNTEMMKTRNVNIGLQTPPESSSSNNSAEGAEEEQAEEMSSVGHNRIDNPPHSSSSHLHWQDQVRRPSGSRSEKKIGFNDEALMMSPTLTTSTATQPNATDARHAISNSPPLPRSMPISRPTSQPATTPSGDSSKSKLLKRKSSLSTPPLKQVHTVKALPSAVQVPPLVLQRDSRPGDHDHGVPVPPMKHLRSASGSGLASGRERGRKTRSMHGDMRSSVDLLEGSRKGSERKGFVGTLKKLGLWM